MDPVRAAAYGQLHIIVNYKRDTIFMAKSFYTLRFFQELLLWHILFTKLDTADTCAKEFLGNGCKCFIGFQPASVCNSIQFQLFW